MLLIESAYLIVIKLTLSQVSESEEECEEEGGVPLSAPSSDPDIPLAIAEPASPPGSDGSGRQEDRQVSPSCLVEVPCHELASPSTFPVQVPRRSARLRRPPDKLKDYELQ